MEETTQSLQDAALQREKKTRLDYVDIAKGIMIAFVVLSHTWFANSDMLGYLVPFSMPVFFFLSGYTYKPGRTYWKKILRRVVTLLIPYVLFNVACNLLYPLYVTLSKLPAWQVSPASEVWLASAKTDALHMLMSTPMWFLVALFTASVLFFIVADKTRESLKWTVVVTAVLVALALAVDIVKTQYAAAHKIDIENTQLVWWFVDLAPYGAAMMVVGAYCGKKQLLRELTVKGVVLGLVCLAVAEVVNHFFFGSARTSVVKYIEGRAWYGVLTAFVVAVTGCIGTLCVARLVQKVPVLRSVCKWLGQNSLWILCIHYAFIMLAEMWLYNKGILSVSLFDVVTNQLYKGTMWEKPIADTTADIFIKIGVAILSVGVSAVYIVIHKKVKSVIKARRQEKAAA